MHEVAKVLEFELQHQSSNEYSGLIVFRIGWFDLLNVYIKLKYHHNLTTKMSLFFFFNSDTTA